ncbi:hypothetical protein CIC12_26595 [Burkholderia sp. SG-MS1]|uniref:tetratricopeptide repeat-containing glycosyltransferase family protein n=1 Tax=Paraburkholderia sp. SG-MS1 TaxID=2023741 RepID=UPI001444F830|nr:tetratricopeptide repeat protein [Paraburkholderia sp. SG-MS1]NKJ50228.1 hypothetical protein [Paraburkholderia sp. SG-MS1]
MRKSGPPRKAASPLLGKLIPKAQLPTRDVRSFNQEAVSLIHAGRREEALRLFEEACRIHPSSVDLWSNRGRLSMEIGNFADAAKCLDQALKLQPRNPDALNNLGSLHYRQKSYAMASDAFSRVLSTSEDHDAARRNLSLSERMLAQELSTQGDFAAACAHFETAIQYAPNDSDLLVSAAMNQRHMGANAAAIAILRKACAVAEVCHGEDPSARRKLAAARCTLGTTLLREGLYAEGWRLYEFRREAHGHAPACPHGLRQWDGRAVPAESQILVECEQGFGDTIQFFRFVERLSKWFEGITLAVQKPLVDLLARSSSSAVVAIDNMPPAREPLTHYATLPSLPALLGVELDDLKPDAAYLFPDEHRIAAWRDRELPLPPALRVGLAWGSSSGLSDNAMRNVAFEDICTLLDVPGVQWFSLQKDVDPTLTGNAPLINWMSDVQDFHDTAALVETLDLVISVDTSVLHLAGAVGVPAWLLNRYTGEWRWLTQQGQSPWYSSVEVFHQERYGDWRPTLSRVRERLQQKIASA